MWHASLKSNQYWRYHLERSGIKGWKAALPCVHSTSPTPQFRHYTTAQAQQQQPDHLEKSLNIIVDDLYATLRAHREWNRSNEFRKEAPVRRLREGEISNAESTGALVSSGSIFRGKNPDDLAHVNLASWPADSVQVLRSQGILNEAEIMSRQAKIASKHKVLEYVGMPQPVQGDWAFERGPHKELATPWLSYMGETASSILEQRLCQEIKAFEAYMGLTLAEAAAASLAQSDVDSALRLACTTRVIGSRSRNLATPLSDLDLSVTPQDHERFGVKFFSDRRGGDNVRRTTTRMLHFVQNCTRRSSKFVGPEIVYARKPIVRVVHRQTGIELQLQGPAQFDLQDELITEYLHDLPNLRPIFVVLRHCLHMRNLTDQYSGGVSSYILLMIIVTALKSISQDTGTLSDQLLFVLSFWAKTDTYNHGFSVAHLGEINKQGQVSDDAHESTCETQIVCLQEMQRFHPKKPYLLCLQDPADYTKDLGKNVYSIKHIQRTFESLHQQLVAILGTNPEETTVESSTLSMLAPLLEANYTTFEQQRNRLECLFEDASPGKESTGVDQSLVQSLLTRAEAYKDRAMRDESSAPHRGQEDLIRKYQSKNLRIKRIPI